MLSPTLPSLQTGASQAVCPTGGQPEALALGGEFSCPSSGQMQTAKRFWGGDRRAIWHLPSPLQPGCELDLFLIFPRPGPLCLGVWHARGRLWQGWGSPGAQRMTHIALSHTWSGLVMQPASQHLAGFYDDDYFQRHLKLTTALKWLGQRSHCGNL